jgi:hypothetical protein
MIGNRSEFISQAGQDAREGGLPRDYVGFVFDSKRDEIENTLWLAGIHLSVIDFKVDSNTVVVKGDYASYIVAKAELSKTGLKTQLYCSSLKS